MMKTVITGGAGFIGSHLVDALIASGVEVHVIDNFSRGNPESVHSKAVLHTADARSEQAKQVILREKPDIVIHLAAQIDVQTSVSEPQVDADINILGTINVLEACAAASVKKFIFASSCAVYGNLEKPLLIEQDPTAPVSYYGISKLAGELYIRGFHLLYGLPYTILRFANVYGPRQSSSGEGGVVAIFLDRIKRGLPLVIYGDGKQTRDFVYVKDVVRAVLAAIDKGDNEVVQIGTAVTVSVNQLAEQLKLYSPASLLVQYEPPRPGEIRHSCLNNQMALQRLKWRPLYSFPYGLRATYLEFMQEA